jgi:hypothetical protein
MTAIASPTQLGLAFFSPPPITGRIGLSACAADVEAKVLLKD